MGTVRKKTGYELRIIIWVTLDMLDFVVQDYLSQDCF